MIEFGSALRRFSFNSNKFFENSFQFSHLAANKSAFAVQLQGESLELKVEIDKFSKNFLADDDGWSENCFSSSQTSFELIRNYFTIKREPLFTPSRSFSHPIFITLRLKFCIKSHMILSKYFAAKRRHFSRLR
jgi:hypothetical protein